MRLHLPADTFPILTLGPHEFVVELEAEPEAAGNPAE